MEQSSRRLLELSCHKYKSNLKNTDSITENICTISIEHVELTVMNEHRYFSADSLPIRIEMKQNFDNLNCERYNR